MKVLINIPDMQLDNIERLLILSGEEPDAIELLSKARTIEEPIDVTECVMESSNSKDQMQFFLGLAACAIGTIKKQKQ